MPQGPRSGGPGPVSRVHGHGVHGDPRKEAGVGSGSCPKGSRRGVREALGNRLVAAPRVREYFRAGRARRGRAAVGREDDLGPESSRGGDPAWLRLRVPGTGGRLSGAREDIRAELFQEAGADGPGTPVPGTPESSGGSDRRQLDGRPDRCARRSRAAARPRQTPPGGRGEGVLEDSVVLRSRNLVILRSAGTKDLPPLSALEVWHEA